MATKHDKELLQVEHASILFFLEEVLAFISTTMLV